MKPLGTFSQSWIAALRRRSAVTLFVLLIVLLAMALTSVNEKRKARADLEARLSKAIERLPIELCKQREVIGSAIEHYKSELGFYPPDRILSSAPLIIDPVTNQLMYELYGTIYDPTNGTYNPGQFPLIKRSVAKRFFNVERFRNSVENGEKVRRFLDKTNLAATILINDRPDVVGLLGYWPSWEGMDADIYQFIDMASWQYNSSRPVHNPGKFDLWIVVETPRTNIIVGNW
jgi:hypothetical protein